MKKPIKVKIDWIDSTSLSKWHEPQDALSWSDKLEHCQSIGYLMGKSKRYTVIAMTRSSNSFQEYGFFKAIPTKAIISCQKLKSSPYEKLKK